MRRTLLIVVLLVVPAVSPRAAEARPWATVNVCDTPSLPDVVGIRGAMPGLRRTSTMFMRFRLQYRAGRRWKFLGAGADSAFIKVATGRRIVFTYGWSFTVRAPPGGARMRGVVLFRWTARGRVLKRSRRVTAGGHRGTVGSDPPGFSAASCTVL